MATAGVGIASAGGAFVGIPYVGWAVGLAAAYIDYTYVYPALAGSPEEARQPQLASLAVSEQGVGAPRTFSLGARMRVPAHVMYQSEKVRETTSGGDKGGTGVPVKRVSVSALIHLNDRKSNRLLQLIGNGQLILYADRNLLGITTENMTAVQSGDNVEFELGSPLDGDFDTLFKAGDLIMPNGMVRVTGTTTFNGTHFVVVSTTAPVSPAGSTMLAYPAEGQTIGTLSYTGGTPFSPSKITRIDDAIGGYDVQIYWSANSYNNETAWFEVGMPGPDGFEVSSINPLIDMRNLFQVGDEVLVRGIPGWEPSGHQKILEVTRLLGSSKVHFKGVRDGITGGGAAPRYNPQGQLRDPFNTSAAGVWGGNGTPTNYGQPFLLTPVSSNANFSTEVFRQDFDPVANFSSGEEDQGQPPVMVTDVGSGETSNYRGMCSQGLDECYVSVFGDQLPTNLEAIIDIDEQMTWSQALQSLLQRGNLRNTQIDASRVASRAFRGASVRGAVPVIQQIQPVLVAGQILSQDRDGAITLFPVDDADSVQIENGDTFSDLGARMYGEQMSYDKMQVVDASESDMPTSVGVRFQDPDQHFSVGYEHFGLRNPSGADHTNEQIVDLSSLVLTRRESKDLATTIMRRAWVNRRKYRMTLPSAYLHLLENDLITWTDDEGEDITARIIQRDIGANFLINVTALREMTSLAVVGSPVQSSAQVIPQNVSTSVSLFTTVIDAPAVANSETQTPAIRLAVADNNNNLQTATVWESQSGNSYQSVGTIGGTCATGYILTPLTAQTASEVFGTTVVSLRTQSCDVLWANEGSEAIEACTQAQAEAGKNWCSIIDQSSDEVEIAAFTTVTPLGNGFYTLGGWLRGLRGTPSVEHENGVIVLLNQSTAGIFLREYPGSQPTSLEYKVVPSGGDLATTPITTVSSPKFRNVLPLPIRNVTKTYNATTLSTRFDVAEHWERQLLPLGTQPPHTLDEPFEAYRVYLYHKGQDSAADSYLMDSRRTGATTLRDTFFDWSNARAVAAGYTPGPSETYQIGYQQIGQWGEGPLRLETI